MPWQKLQLCNFPGHYICDECQTLHDGTTYYALPVHITYNDLDHISRSGECKTVLTENVLLSSD